MKNENFKIDENLIWIGGGIAIAAAIGIGIWYYRRKRRSTSGDYNETSVAGTSRGFQCKSSTYPLTFGTCHPDVKILQRALKKKGADLGKTGSTGDGVDGQFGNLTLSNAKKYLGKDSFSQSDIQNLKA
ncbi:hypothetical protein GCM10009122_23270 [Fulvivirga kasyanovii]|uniref:Peptidoglycan-binding protein n=1 Tax=Fulvivirga kasyanovii TaxID=396812 RepID=A0ABW9RXK2_9BACT|nr:hypothetical protein [Fulvivirga kasyanovii]MTI28967.1 hypothetical protein [Fulvivirga kasyanovii]